MSKSIKLNDDLYWDITSIHLDPDEQNTLHGNVCVDRGHGVAGSNAQSYFSIGNDKTIDVDGNTSGVLRLYTNQGTGLQIRPDYRQTYSKDAYYHLPVTDSSESFLMTDEGGHFKGNVRMYHTDGTAGTAKNLWLQLGNNVPYTQAGSSKGVLQICGATQYYTNIYHAGSGNPTANRILYLPDASGTLPVIDSDGNMHVESLGTANTKANGEIILGNSTPFTSDGHSEGLISLFGKTGKWTCLRAYDSTANRYIDFPDAAGTIALTSDIKVTGVKGNSESSYRTGNVNLTAANIGAYPVSGGNIEGDVQIYASTGTAGTVSNAWLQLGNNIDSSKAGNSRGVLQFYDQGTYRMNFYPINNLSDNRSIRLPDASGTVSLSSSSSSRYKTNISYNLNDEFDPHKLLNLKVAQFKYKDKSNLQYADMKSLLMPGFIA